MCCAAMYYGLSSCEELQLFVMSCRIETKGKYLEICFLSQAVVANYNFRGSMRTFPAQVGVFQRRVGLCTSSFGLPHVSGGVSVTLEA